VPDTIDNDPLEGEGVSERRQLQQALEADALVDLRHLLEQTHQGDLAQGGQVLLQLCHVLGGLDKLQSGLDSIAKFERVEVNLKPLVEVLERLSRGLKFENENNL
jgi:hypothetical protein